MLIVFAIISAILGVLLFASLPRLISTFKEWMKLIVACLLLAATFGGLLFRLFMPCGGYKETQLVESYEVVSFILDDKEIYAVDDNDECTVFIRVKIITAKGEKSSAKLMQLDGATVIVPEEKCKRSRVAEYLERGKGSIWSLAKEEDRTIYRIYVPTGTVYSSDE
jgi:hypothetical protein